MSWWLPDNFNNKKENLYTRAKIISNLRQFFDKRSFLEVQTPALQVCPVMDTHIHAFKTICYGVGRVNTKEMYLHTSPEFDMKKLLSAGMERIYQICPVYRNAESSSLHSPEFTILEWYRSGEDYHTVMDDCVDILRSCASNVGIESYSHKGISCDPFDKPLKITVAQAFKDFAGIDIEKCLEDRDKFALAASGAGVRVIDIDQWDDIFHAVMASRIEPYLGQGAPALLYDYPVCMAALSRRKDNDRRYAERFEMYVCGVELANGFSELTDSVEQRNRYAREMAAKKELYDEVYPADEEFFKALDYMPESAGVALGVDRLVMLLTAAEDINDVLWSPVNV